MMEYQIITKFSLRIVQFYCVFRRKSSASRVFITGRICFSKVLSAWGNQNLKHTYLLTMHSAWHIVVIRSSVRSRQRHVIVARRAPCNTSLITREVFMNSWLWRLKEDLFSASKEMRTGNMQRIAPAPV